jgi:UDP-N-acetyl-2-amino-2-deoxyglucuronate dehydrogenase
VTGSGRIRLAVVGCGYITQAEHVPALLAALPRVEVVAMIDTDRARAAAVAAPFGAKAFGSFSDALSTAGFDAVLIATPARTHVALIAQAASAGKHILVEKPIAYSLSEAREAIRTVAESGVTCMVAYHRRYDDDCRRVRALLSDGAIGDVRAAVSQCRLTFPSVYSSYAPILKATSDGARESGQDFRGDWLIENSIHHINVMRFWLGPVTDVHSAIYREEDHDLGIVTLSFGGVLASHHQLRGMECGEEISLYGSRGALHVSLWYPHRPYAFPKIILFDREASMRREVILARASPYTNELMAFLDLLRGEAGNVSTLEDSFEDLLVLKKIQDIATYTHASR